MIKATSSYLNLAPRSKEEAERDVAKNRATDKQTIAKCKRRFEAAGSVLPPR